MNCFAQGNVKIMVHIMVDKNLAHAKSPGFAKATTRQAKALSFHNLSLRLGVLE
jgi:hypothetical protein